ncbi:MAG TPA: DUF6485 family protein [Spirochaetia bacterium]|nr:DUF6485 family protein [Spirochaetia bacterium]
MQCANSEKNARRCTCTYPGCSRHGICCDCVAYHRGAGELPGCLFAPAEEKTYDRSVRYFVASRR